MTIQLDKPLAWMTAKGDEEQLLNDLQGNILKGHGRDHTVNLFLRFDADRPERAKAFVNALADDLPSAMKQLKDAASRKTSPSHDGGTFKAFFLSAKGYEALGRAGWKPTPTPAPPFTTADVFGSGMKASAVALGDPPPETWNELFRNELHAMILVADSTAAQRDVARASIEQSILATKGAVKLLGAEVGTALRNNDYEGIEHFGYVDGRSQPLMLVEDIYEEDKKHGGIDQWNPTVPLGQVLVASPGGASSASYGSYFVFRKLEQNVRGFKKDEKRLADFLQLGVGIKDPAQADAQREVAGAFVVGRFENGTPVVQSNREKDVSVTGVPNNFNYEGDAKGLKCPFAGHIRKSNPRGESEAKLPAEFKGTEKGHLMARRGITYGERKVDPNTEGLRFEDMPTGDVGLLFMAYQCNLANQFEFTQRSWVNAADFVNAGVGIDPVIGQAAAASGQHWPSKWNEPLKEQAFDFSRWVTMQGGEYFFAPSLSTLKAI